MFLAALLCSIGLDRSAATAVLMSHCSWKSTLAALLRQVAERGGCERTLTPALERNLPAFNTLHMLLKVITQITAAHSSH